MTMLSQESGGTERLGAFPFRLAEGWKTSDDTAGLICIELAEGWSEKMAVSETEEPRIWDAWLLHTLEGESARFGDRIGSHLWIYAEIPELWKHSPHPYIDGLARRIRESIETETETFFGFRPASAFRRGPGFGAALVFRSAGRPLKESLYEAFLTASSNLRQRKAPEPDASFRVEMERILRNGGIRSVYQPLFLLKSGSLFGYEALTRCLPGSRFDGPLSLFRYAEQEGYSYALDRLARETAIRSCPLLGPKQKIFINVNSGIMNDPHFVSGQTLQWLNARGLGPGQVVLELTERSSIDDFEEAKKLLGHYRRQGYEIAIDDAGAGYSSLQAIVELRPDYIKLDKSLVQDADRDEMKKQMLRTFVRFARRMQIRTVAEGIERPEELGLVRAMGIDLGQGYLIGRPSADPARIQRIP